ncbi:MAG: hypothetical protein WC518_00370 [Patescibacteria group bacterium]
MNGNLENKTSQPLKKKEGRFGFIVNQFFPLMVVVIFLAVLIGGYLLVVRWQYEKLISSRADLQRLKTGIINLEQREKLLKKYQSEGFRFSENEQDLLSLALPKDFDLPAFIIQLKNLADNYGFLINNIKITETAAGAAGNKVQVAEQANHLKKLGIELELIGGDYGNWKKVLTAMESSIMIFDVTALDFSADNPVYKLKLVTYYYN